jgi:3-oxoadipate enol-lactonase
MLAGMDERANLAKITSPTLVLAGKDDSLLVPAAMQDVADAILDCQIKVLATGHFLAVNTPDLWAKTVLPFFD